MSAEDFDFEPKKTALLLIEFENEFCTEGGKLHGAVKECMEKTNMLENSKKVLDAARAAGVTVIHCPIAFEKVSGRLRLGCETSKPRPDGVMLSTQGTQ